MSANPIIRRLSHDADEAAKSGVSFGYKGKHSQHKAVVDVMPAIAQLETDLDVIERNEPGNRKRGNIAQANLERNHAVSFKAAIEKLKT